jgi:hypothetical protein
VTIPTDPTERTYIPGAEAFSHEGDTLSPDEAAADESRIGYYLAGIWTNDGQLVWSSAPDSFFLESSAITAAERKLGELNA